MSTVPCAEPDLLRRERGLRSRGALNTTRGLAGGTGFPPRELVGKPRLPHKALEADVNVVVVVGEGERRAPEPEQ